MQPELRHHREALGERCPCARGHDAWWRAARVVWGGRRRTAVMRCFGSEARARARARARVATTSCARRGCGVRCAHLAWPSVAGCSGGAPSARGRRQRAAAPPRGTPGCWR
eukprot:521153-Prymnesium_polylepis.1